MITARQAMELSEKAYPQKFQIESLINERIKTEAAEGLTKVLFKKEMFGKHLHYFSEQMKGLGYKWEELDTIIAVSWKER